MVALRPAAADLPDGRPDKFLREAWRALSKFGGHVVADVRAGQKCRRRVKCEMTPGNEVAVVVSAMAREDEPADRLDA